MKFSSVLNRLRSKLRDIKIWNKMLLLLVILAIPTLVMFGTFAYVMNKMHGMETKVLRDSVSSIRAAYKVEISLLNLKGLNANYILDTDKKWLSQFKFYVDDFNYWYNRAFVYARTDEEHNILSNISLKFANHAVYHRQIVNLVDMDRELDALKVQHAEAGRNYAAIVSGCEKLVSKSEDLIKKSQEDLQSYLDRTLVIGYAVIGFFLLAGILSTAVITKSIIDPIKEIEEGSRSLVPLDSKKREMEGLKERFEGMVRTIQENQQRLVQSEKKAAIGQIAAGISHELNNPIGIICGFAERLMQSGTFAKKDKEAVQTIYSEAQRCRSMLGQLLDFARTPQPNFRWSGIKELLRDMVRIFTNQDKYGGVRFEVSLPRESVKAYMDSVQMRQVLLNIVLNACDAMENSGEIRIGLETGEPGISIKIRDNGPGIKPEDKDRIFYPFFSTKPKGVGLGLAVCRDIVEKHNGSLTVESEPGSYTEFCINLPRGKNGTKEA